MEPKFFTVVVGALVQVLCPILIDAFCCRRHVSCSGYHEPDSLTMTTGKGSSSFTHIITSVAMPVLFCARTCHHFTLTDFISSSYWSSTVLRALLCAIPRYRHDAISLTMERLEGLPLSGPPHELLLTVSGTASIRTRRRQSSSATGNNRN